MKANNLTICINAHCNNNCPYCISKMTFAPLHDPETFRRNIHKAYKLASMAGVSSVLITSKGEPLLNRNDVMFVMDRFRDFPLEIQTNGTLLDSQIINLLYMSHINTIAVSLDSLEIDSFLENAFREMYRKEIVSRVTLVLTDKFQNTELDEILNFCKDNSIKQLTLRKASLPSKVIDTPAADETKNWIRNNTAYNYPKLFNALENFMTNDNLIRRLPWGAIVYDVNGLAITVIDYCIQSSNNSDDIRSLIYHQDGHMYTSWDKPSSILF